ncbi:MAG: hypothetical protein MJ154_03150 [Candidatus Saccharibacteria bacterium]|nr:hypothetical protein [Candidatus Saccharibacteria bacterium]
MGHGPHGHMGHGPYGHMGPGGPHGPHGHIGPGGPYGPHGHMGPYGFHGGPYGHHGHFGPGRGFFFFPFFGRGRNTGNSAAIERVNTPIAETPLTKKIEHIRSDGTIDTSIVYLDEKKEREKRTLWGEIKAWFIENFTI